MVIASEAKEYEMRFYVSIIAQTTVMVPARMPENPASALTGDIGVFIAHGPGSSGFVALLLPALSQSESIKEQQQLAREGLMPERKRTAFYCARRGRIQRSAYILSKGAGAAS